ncbi:MAG: preprotein translocase subunit Sec61beta [archaeon]
MANQGISMPSSFGGLMRYNEEYKSSIRMSPTHVIIFIVAIVAFVATMKLLWPIAI